MSHLNSECLICGRNNSDLNTLIVSGQRNSCFLHGSFQNVSLRVFVASKSQDAVVAIAMSLPKWGRQGSPPQTHSHQLSLQWRYWNALVTRDVIGINKSWFLGVNGSHGIDIVLKILLCLRFESPANLKFADYNCINYANKWFFFSCVWAEYGMCNLGVCDVL